MSGRRKKEVRQRIRSTDVTDVTDVSPMEVGRRKRGEGRRKIFPIPHSPHRPLSHSSPLPLFPSSHLPIPHSSLIIDKPHGIII
ncbi:hypothetical protein QUA07_23820 [Microcoleus sp. T3_A4]|uniref:hypothetical protein n=1 Tax=Microcoleus sp. T3_A4 TaxID=2818968 RepID=UPI002FD25BCA